MKFMNNNLLNLAILTIFGLLLTETGLTQNFEVAPIKLNFNSNPGETQSKTITVKNHGNSRTAITLTLRDYLVYQDGSRKIVSQGSAKNSIGEWITLNPAYMELNPNEAQTVQVNFQAPNDDYTSKWGILSVSTAKEQTAFSADQELSAGINIYGRIDVELYYTPQTGNDPRVTISNLQEVTSPEDTARKFTVSIDNLGNILTDCKIYLIASNLNTLKEKKFEPLEITAYPQTSRNVELTLPDVLSPGSYSLSAILDYGSNEALEGTQITIEVE
jgi:hypothetical protein